MAISIKDELAKYRDNLGMKRGTYLEACQRATHST